MLTSDGPTGTTQSVLGANQTSVTPSGRQTFTLSGSDGVTRATATVTVVARGIYLAAGSPIGAAGIQDGPAGSSTVTSPNFLTFDTAGNLFFTDNGSQLIRELDTHGVVSTIAGVAYTGGSADGPVATATFHSPNGIAVDAQGNLYIADGSSQEIRRIGTDGMVTTVAGAAGISGTADGQGSAARFNVPAGIVIDPQGNLLITDLLNNTIRIIDTLGNVSTWAGHPGVAGATDGPRQSATFGNPDGLWFDGAGNLFVSEVGNNDVRRIDSSGNVSTVIGGLTYPSNLCGDADGNLYIADTNAYVVRKLDSQGSLSVVAGTGVSHVYPEALPGGLDNTHGLMLSPMGDLFVISSNQIVQIIGP